jgi:hypothetical protein
MGNGANLAFRKTAFEAAGGYNDDRLYASGDDMFLLQKVEKKWPGSVRFLKNRDAVVHTCPMPNERRFFQQRLRWGSKNAALPEWPIRLALLAVWLFCWSILVNLLYNLYEIFQRPSVLRFGALFVVQIMTKALADYLFLSILCRYFRRKDLLQAFWKSFLMHTLYIIVLGTASIFRMRFTWKERRTI